jgi:putative membrane protein
MMKFRMLPAVLLLAGCATTQQQNLTDSDIAMIMRVANIAEVREGELARSKTTDNSVREFAIMMVTEHTAQNNKAESELARVDIASSDTDLSRQLDAESGTTTERLRALSGAAFDRAYIDSQVSAHQSLISMIDSKLMPHSRKKAVKEQLTELRKLADTHLTRAKQIQGSLPR